MSRKDETIQLKAQIAKKAQTIPKTSLIVQNNRQF